MSPFGIGATSESLDDLLKKLQQAGDPQLKKNADLVPGGDAGLLQQVPDQAPGKSPMAELLSGVSPPGVGDPGSAYGVAGPYNPPPSPASGGDEMAALMKNVDALPKAPSGDFFIPGANSGQAGSLIPLTGGQPTPIMDQANRRSPSGTVGPAGSFPAGMEPNIVTGVQSTPLPIPQAPGGMGAGAPPPAMLAKQSAMGAVGGPLGALLGGGAVAPPAPNTGWTMNGQPAAPPQSSSVGSQYLPKEVQDALLGGGPVPAEWGNRLGPAGTPGDADKFMTMPGGNRMPVNTPQQEAAANLTFAQQQTANDPKAFAVLMQQMDDADKEKYRSAEAAKARGGALDVAKEQSRGHIEGARVAAGGHESAEDRQIDAAVAAKKISPERGKAMKDEAAARRPGGAASSSAPASTAPGGNKTVAQVDQAESRIASLRAPFVTIDPTGHPIPSAAATPKMMHDLVDKLDPKEVPEVAAAIKRGDFGDKSSVIKALGVATGQNYLMDQGVPDIEGKGIPGKLDTGLLSLIRNPAATMVGRMGENFKKRATGSPYTHVEIPGYGQVPFDTTDLHGLSAGASNLGLGANDKRAAKGRLDKQSLLLDALLSGGQ